VSAAITLTPSADPAVAGALTLNEPTKDPVPAAGLSPEVVALLRDSVQRWAHGNGAEHAALGNALRTAATEARDRGIRAEELVVALKATWFDVGGSPPTSHSPGARRLDELITACIKAYYT
jgi:hypothetical protein